MKKYIVNFTADTECLTYLDEDKYFTEKGLKEFIEETIKAFKRDYPKIEVIKQKNHLVIDNDFFIHYREYETPTFIDTVQEISDFSFANDGYDSSCLGIVIDIV